MMIIKKKVFCYCYKYTGKLSWFFNFVSNDYQKGIIIISFINFYLQFITIGLIKKINEEIVNKPFKISNSLFLTYFLTFILYLLLSHIVSIIIEKCCINDNKKVLGVNIIVWTVSSACLIISIIFLFSIVISILHIFINITFINDNNLLLIPIILNELFYFTQSKFCSNSIGENKTFELLSNSTTLSIYILF